MNQPLRKASSIPSYEIKEQSESMDRDIITTIGNTPLIALTKKPEEYARILVKLENRNPFGSIKDRIALSMIEQAERDGSLKAGGIIIEPTSGNTGVALAAIGRKKGYKVILVMPDTMSVERRQLLTAFGAELVLTPGKEGMTGAIAKARELRESLRAFMPMQFENPANPRAHETSTGPEIWEAAGHAIDYFVAGVGTGGTITGVGRYLKRQNPSIKLVAVEPADSPVLSGGKPGTHAIQGIGAGFIPPILDRTILDEVLTVTNDDAKETARSLARNESITAGISSGANVWAARKLASCSELTNKTIVTIICDTGERYLSTGLFV